MVGVAVASAFALPSCGGSSGSDEAGEAEAVFDDYWAAAFAGDGEVACSLLVPDLQESLLRAGSLFGSDQSTDCQELVVTWADDLTMANGGSPPDFDLADIEVQRPVGELPEFVDDEVELFAIRDAVVGDGPTTTTQLVEVGGRWLIATPPGPFPQE